MPYPAETANIPPSPEELATQTCDALDRFYADGQHGITHIATAATLGRDDPRAFDILYEVRKYAPEVGRPQVYELSPMGGALRTQLSVHLIRGEAPGYFGVHAPDDPRADRARHDPSVPANEAAELLADVVGARTYDPDKQFVYQYRIYDRRSVRGLAVRALEWLGI